MSVWHFIVAALALSIERICYVWVWHFPETFRRVCITPVVASLGDPVEVLRKLFFAFKGIQFSVFLGWCYIHGGGSVAVPSSDAVWLGLGTLLIGAGQVLNFGVFYQLGKIGVFYGNKFGYSVPWCAGFPFSLLRHPQYVGTVLSIWGFFLAMRFPYDDWYVLPILQTGYYLLGSYFEQ